LLDDQHVPSMVASYNLPITADGPGPFPVPLPKSYEAVLGRQRVMMFTDQHTQTLAPLPALTQGVFWNALVCIPLVDEQRVVGAICLTFAEIRGLNEDEQRVLMAFARQAATVIANARLFRKLQESQAELIQSSKLAAVGTFAAGIAHEFNNLLAGMLGYAQLGLSTGEGEIKNESLKVVVDTCRRGKSITGSLLTFARRQEPAASCDIRSQTGPLESSAGGAGEDGFSLAQYRVPAFHVKHPVDKTTAAGWRAFSRCTRHLQTA
ncbi:MAG: GAF domain-containing protein, partial [Myxococcales bacterium]|nr:GAF domain-containing protein [Myxococcales bacterium]